MKPSLCSNEFGGSVVVPAVIEFSHVGEVFDFKDSWTIAASVSLVWVHELSPTDEALDVEAVTRGVGEMFVWIFVQWMEEWKMNSRMDVTTFAAAEESCKRLDDSPLVEAEPAHSSGVIDPYINGRELRKA